MWPNIVQFLSNLAHWGNSKINTNSLPENKIKFLNIAKNRTGFMTKNINILLNMQN